jgi:hypothetical protein
MATLYAYPLATPKNADLMVGTSIPLPNTNKDEQARTVNFSVSSIVALISTATGAQTFQQVTNIGQVAIGVDSVSITTNNIKIGGIFFDSASTKGTANQILTSNATGKLIWSDAAATSNFYLTGLAFATATGILTATVTGASDVTVDLDGRYMSSLTTTGTGAAAFTQATGVLNIPTPVIPFTSLTTTGSGAATLNSGVLNIPTPTFTEVDTLATVTGRGASTTVTSTFSGGINSGVLNVNGTGANGYLYVTGNSQGNQPTNVQGMAFSYNNNAGLRENELFWNPGIQTAAENDTKSLIIINEYLDSANSNARVTAPNVKLYGTGVFELTKPNASLVTPHFSSPIVAGVQNSLLVRSNTKQTAFTTTLSYNETNATLAILPASGTPSEIQMKSADNSIWKLTISNAGALVITSA